MSKYCSITTIALGLTIAFSVWAVGSMDALAQCMNSGGQHGAHAGHEPAAHAGGQHGAHAGHGPVAQSGGQHGAHAGQEQGGHAGHDQGSGPGAGGSPMAQQCSHGGQMTIAGPHCFEVVYQPKETRVYLHGADHRPMSMRGVQGHMLMQVRGNDKVFRYPLMHVMPQAGSTGQDYLAAMVDVSRVRDGDMTATFELANLPNTKQSQAKFSQVFALSRIPVTVASLDQSDRPRIEQQKVCPVSRGRLGSMGPPVKVLVGDQAVYLCCKGCLGKVQEDPEFYLKKPVSAESLSDAPASADRIVAAKATASDQAAIQAQRECPVLGTTLGSHGMPIKVGVGEQTLFVCCKGCVRKVVENPDDYLAKAAELRTGG